MEFGRRQNDAGHDLRRAWSESVQKSLTIVLLSFQAKKSQFFSARNVITGGEREEENKVATVVVVVNGKGKQRQRQSVKAIAAYIQKKKSLYLCLKSKCKCR